jgi:hypothetical protein
MRFISALFFVLIAVLTSAVPGAALALSSDLMQITVAQAAPPAAGANPSAPAAAAPTPPAPVPQTVPAPAVAPQAAPPPAAAPVQAAPAQAAPAPAARAQPAAAPATPVQASSPRAAPDCMGDNVFDPYHTGIQLRETKPFVPAGKQVEFIMKAPFDPAATYYAKIVPPRGVKGEIAGGRNLVTVGRMPEESAFVKSGLASKDDSLVRIDVPDDVGQLWGRSTIRVYGCYDGNAPIINSKLEIFISSWKLSSGIVVIVTILAYVAAAFAFRDQDGNKNPNATLRFLNPIAFTAGGDGGGSLSKLQILFFSLIVFALLSYILLRTGELTDLSSTILLLLGIAAVGSTTAKATDAKQNSFSAENWRWLVNKDWLKPGKPAPSKVARWSDLVTTDGEFDVYRYQSCIFSLVVGGALMFVGAYQLASFNIPETLLGLLGLSQVVYVTGKLVSPTAIADADKEITALRLREQNLKGAVAKLSPAPASLLGSAVDADYQAYMDAAAAAAKTFAAATGREQPTNFEPSVK